MAIKVLGRNTKQEFSRNRYNFVIVDNFDAYHQTASPVISYTDNPQNAVNVQDVFAVSVNDNDYLIVEYQGPNLISTVETELMDVRQNTI